MDTSGEPQLGGEVREAPGPSDAELRESFQSYMNDPLVESMRLYERYGDVVALRRGPFVTIFLFHPDHAKHVLVKELDKYSRRTTPAQKLKASLGDGIITSDKPEWTRQRKMAQPGFTKKAITQGVPMFNDMARSLVEVFERDGGKGPIDVHHPGGVALLNLVGRLLLSEAFGEEKGDRLRNSLSQIARIPVVPNADAIRLAERSAQGAEDFKRVHAEFLETRAILDAELERVIQERRESGSTSGDMLSVLIEERDEDGVGYTDSEIRDQLKSLVIAGHDTTMATLSFAQYFLAKHPECWKRLRAEVEAVAPSGDLSMDQIDRLTYAEAIVSETLRLCPPVAHIDRRAEEEDVISGYRIPRGAAVALCPYVVQRRADLWPDALQFRPERFLEKQKGAYFPFSLGPRTCLGRSLSILEVKLFLAHLVRRFELRVPDDYKLELETSWTVHPRGSKLSLWVETR